jgi:hypothetical protein
MHALEVIIARNAEQVKKEFETACDELLALNLRQDIVDANPDVFDILYVDEGG